MNDILQKTPGESPNNPWQLRAPILPTEYGERADERFLSALESPFLVGAPAEIERDIEAGDPALQIGAPTEMLEEPQAAEAWESVGNLAAEAPPPIFESAAEFDPYAAIRPALSPEHAALTADEITAVLGPRPAILALHGLLSQPELPRAVLASLLGKTGRRSVFINGADIPIAVYLRRLSSLCREAADYHEAELGTAIARTFPIPRTGDGRTGSGTGSGSGSVSAPGAATPAAPTVVPPYGGYDLRYNLQATRTDSDIAKRWGGTVRAAPSPLPAAGQLGFVSQLKRDLRTLGFKLIDNTNGVFDLRTFWAVREFQIYAALGDIAQEAAGAPIGRYVDRLARTGNPQPYAGPVSGVVNADTRTLLQLWLTNRFRCPVVVDALLPDAAGNFTIVRAENIWDRHDYPHTDARMFARDFTFQYAPLPAGHIQDEEIVLGDFAILRGESGPSSEHGWAHWTTSEMTPETLAGAAGAALNTLDPTVQACYRVIRAVAEVECHGFFDEINAYDNVFLSQGPYHNPIGEANETLGGELCGVLAEFLANDAAGYESAFGRFGIRPKKAWGTNGLTLINTISSRRFLTTLTLSNETGGFDDINLSAGSLNMLRTWHWFYRFEMAGRTSDAYRQAIWRASRARLRALILTTFGHGVADVPNAGATGNRHAVIWDLYTSELALALILRWHVRFPAHMVSGFVAGTRLNNAFQRARVAGAGPAAWGPPSAWTNAHEQALIDALMDEVATLGNAGLSQTMTTVRNFPGLDNGRGSFHMDTTSLGAAV